MVSTRDGEIDIVHNITLGKTNFLMKKSSNFKVVVSLKNKGTPTKIKDLKKEILSKGKSAKFDQLYSIFSCDDLKTINSLSHSNVNYCSYTFCLIKILEIIYKFDEESISADAVIFRFITKMKYNSSNEASFNQSINSFKDIIS